MYAFDIERPTTVAEAVNALKTDEAQPLGGGQTLIPTLKARLAAPSKLVSLSAIAEMIGISREGSTIRIGGATTHGQVATELAESYPALGYLASKIGDPAVRNRGTIGGSVANNDPAACYPAACLASGATITTNTRDDRVHPAHARKFAARLEAQGHDHLYFEDTAGGHSNDADPVANARRWARHYVYLAQQLMD